MHITHGFRYISRLSILPWVLKDKKYSPEDGIRFLGGDVYDNEVGIMGGCIAPGKKEIMGYKEATYTYNYACESYL